MNWYLTILIGYSLLLVLVGLILARRVQTASDFFVAGRRLGTGLLFSTLLAANIGAGSTVGAAALAYSLGLSAWWWVGSAGIGSLILAWLVGPRIHALAARDNFYTVGDFLEARYGTSVRALIALLLWLGSLFILAGQLIAFGWILNVVAGVPRQLGGILGGLVVVAYFSAGGLRGAAWINLIQLSVKLTGFLLAIPYVLTALGGWSGLRYSLAESGKGGEYLSPVGIGAVEIFGFVALLVPSFIVSPGLLQKIYGARDSRTVRRATALNGAALLLFAGLPVFLGIAAAARSPRLPSADMALPTTLTDLLPFWLGAILLASIFSAEISSADAVLFMLSTSLSRDLYQRFVRPDLDDGQLLRISRRIALASGLLGVLLAMLLTSVIEALTIFYSLLSVALFAPLLFGLFSRRPGRNTCLAAIGVSVTGTLLFQWIRSGESLGLLSATAFGILIATAIFAVRLGVIRWRISHHKGH